ncbi:MAG TPA: type II toxin-antitoxin system RelE/ParE family toxin [Chitinophagales bacterium]
MVEIHWTEESRLAVKSIAEYISRDSVFYAEKQVQKFFEAVEVLHEHPQIGKPVPEYNHKNIREILVGKYRIIYVLKTETHIDIVTVHHSARLLHLDIEL